MARQSLPVTTGRSILTISKSADAGRSRVACLSSVTRTSGHPMNEAMRALALERAPIVRLHPNEEFMPMAVSDFLANCRLLWVSGNRKDGFRTTDFAPGASGVPPAVLSATQGLHGPSDWRAWSRRPHDARIAEDGRMAVLAHEVDEPSADFDEADPPPAFCHVYQLAGNTYIAYWLFYGHSKFLGTFQHQGDWEHVTLRLKDGVADGAFFAVHHYKYFVDPSNLEYDDGRIVVYSAKNRHASWWKAGDYVPQPPPWQDEEEVGELGERRRISLPFLKDETSSEGVRWDVSGNLQVLADQPWRHYAGAWGRLGKGNNGTGPLGPWYKRELSLDEKVYIEKPRRRGVAAGASDEGEPSIAGLADARFDDIPMSHLAGR